MTSRTRCHGITWSVPSSNTSTPCSRILIASSVPWTVSRPSSSLPSRYTSIRAMAAGYGRSDGRSRTPLLFLPDHERPDRAGGDHGFVERVRGAVGEVVPRRDDLPALELAGAAGGTHPDDSARGLQEVACVHRGQELDLLVAGQEPLVAVVPDGKLGGQVAEELPDLGPGHQVPAVMGVGLGHPDHDPGLRHVSQVASPPGSGPRPGTRPPRPAWSPCRRSGRSRAPPPWPGSAGGPRRSGGTVRTRRAPPPRPRALAGGGDARLAG